MRLVRGRVLQDNRSTLWYGVRNENEGTGVFMWTDVYQLVEKVIASRVGIVCRHVSGEVL